MIKSINPTNNLLNIIILMMRLSLGWMIFSYLMRRLSSPETGIGVVAYIAIGLTILLLVGLFLRFTVFILFVYMIIPILSLGVFVLLGPTLLAVPLMLALLFFWGPGKYSLDYLRLRNLNKSKITVNNEQQGTVQESESTPKFNLRSFLEKYRKIIIFFIIIVAVFYVNVKIMAGGSSVIGCYFQSYWYGNKLGGDPTPPCARDLGEHARQLFICDVLPSTFATDSCKTAYAIKNKAPDSCSKVTLPWQPDCYERLAIKMGDISVCDQSSQKDLCRYAFNSKLERDYRANLDPCLRDPAYWGNDQNMCQLRNDPVLEPCRKIESLDVKQNCFADIALKELDVKFCGALDPTIYGYGATYECILNIAQQSRTLGYCNLLPIKQKYDLVGMAICYRDILHIPGGAGPLENSTQICNAVIDQNEKDSCHALLAYLTLYEKSYIKNTMVAARIKEEIKIKCEPILSQVLKVWCQDTISNRTLENEPDHFPDIIKPPTL